MFAPPRFILRVAMSLALVLLSVSCMSVQDDHSSLVTAPVAATTDVLTHGDGDVIVTPPPAVSDAANALYAIVSRSVAGDLPTLLISAGNGGATGRDAGFTLIGRVLSLHDKLELTGEREDPAGAATRLTAFIKSVYALMGYPAPALSAAALGTGGAVQVVRAASGGTVRTGDLSAGLRFPASALKSDAIVVIEPLASAKWLPTSLPQHGPYYEFSTFPRQSFSAPVQLAVRLGSEASPYTGDRTWARIAHPDPTTPSIIQLQTAVGCPEGIVFAFSRAPEPVTMSGTSGDAPPSDDAILTEESARRPVISGSACQFSPHGTVIIYDPYFNTKQLSVVGTCSGNARIRNSSSAEVVVRYTVDGTSQGGSVTLAAGNAKGRPWSEYEVPQTGRGRVRVFYGPVAINPNGDGSCGG